MLSFYKCIIEVQLKRLGGDSDILANETGKMLKNMKRSVKVLEE